MSDHLVTVGDHTVTLELDDGDVVTDVLVLARVMRLDTPGQSGITVGASDGMDEIVHRGLLDMARAVLEWDYE